jgi:hypothetical protein
MEDKGDDGGAGGDINGDAIAFCLCMPKKFPGEFLLGSARSVTRRWPRQSSPPTKHVAFLALLCVCVLCVRLARAFS